jgi:hypothetical protein
MTATVATTFPPSPSTVRTKKIKEHQATRENKIKIRDRHSARTAGRVNGTREKNKYGEIKDINPRSTERNASHPRPASKSLAKISH